MAINYVKFIRGTPTAFAKLNQKDKDTLYFISETDSKKGSLYLGEKIISQNISSFEELNNIFIENLKDKDILSYDSNSEKWVNKSIIDAIGVMTGATQSSQGAVGLVPAPGIGQDGLFLRGDGVWATPIGNGSNVNVKPDEKTISFSNDGVTIALKDFGVKYYKFIPEQNGIKAHYKSQNVDSSNPWKENLIAKVTIDDNGQFILGWFEEDPTIKEEINKLTSKINEVNVTAEENKTQINQVSTSITNLEELLNNKINEVDAVAKENSIQITNIKSSVNNLATLLNGKADASSVYTKAEVDAKILEAGHLTRKTFESLDKANEFALSVNNPEAYVYMVASGNAENNKYVEYLYVEGTLELVGSWDVNLEGYATKEEVNTISNSLGTLNTRVESLEEFMNSDYFNGINSRLDTVESDLDEVKDAVTWRDLI